MLVDHEHYTNVEAERRALERRVVKEGTELWKKQKEHEKFREHQEQKELKEMLDNYWPWSNSLERPRGLKNLRLEGLFPYKDFENAKRFSGEGEISGGGGAPLFSNTGRKITRTHEDPFLRFQFSKDLRKYVDNNLRYKTKQPQQEEYKKQLDKLVEEKKHTQKNEKEKDAELIRKQFSTTPPWGRCGPGGKAWRHPFTIGMNFFKSMGWSNEETLKEINKENQPDHDTEMSKKMMTTKLNRNTKGEPMIYPGKNIFTTVKDRKLSPLRESKEHGAELVTLLAKKRRNNIRIPLASTDVTSWGKHYDSSIWKRTGSAHLKELRRQIEEKQQQFEIRKREQEISQRHFATWESFWGRPGYGAPLSVTKKQKLGPLIFPQMAHLYAH